MTHSDQLTQQLAELHSLASLQRSLRLGLRAFWLCAAGILLGWGLHAVFGWLPNPVTWVLAGLGLALFPLVSLLSSFLPQSRWVWILDRRLGLQEQVSTAWEVVQQERGGPVSDALVLDMLAVLPPIKSRMLKMGWFIKGDLVSTLIVLLLGCTLLAAGLVRLDLGQLGPPPTGLIPLTAQSPVANPSIPDQAQAQPSSQGDSRTHGGSEESSQPQDGQSGSEPGQPPSTDMGAATDALRQMGAELSQQAGTYDLGKALERGDMEASADALQDLAGQLDDLSPESRKNLAEAMQKAAKALDQAGASPLSQDMEDAANSLQESDQDAKNALDQVAGDLRQLGSEMDNQGNGGAGTGSGQSTGTGNPESLSRLQDEGGNMDLPLDDQAQSGLLSPAPPDAAGEGVAGGSQDSVTQPGDDSVQSPLLPNSFLWKWRDVVSQYFQR